MQPTSIGNENRLDPHLRDKGKAYLKNRIGKILKIDPQRIDDSESLEKYGIDSILVVQLTNSLSELFSNVDSTLLFEHSTIDALVDHFIKTERETLIRLVGLEDGRDSDKSDVTSVATERVQRRVIESRSRRFMRREELARGEPGPGRPWSKDRDIAIIGVSGRYPQARNLEQFWTNLREGKNCISEIPEERWDWREYFSEERGKRGSIYTKWGGFIDDIDKFDPLFFRTSPREAEWMDPQERLFLEQAFACIEDAGYTPASLCESRKVGVFVGVMNGRYSRLPTGSHICLILEAPV
jgi:aryl carrier-like protein